MTVLNGHLIRQYVIVIVANLAFFQIGVSVGYMSPAMVKLRDENQTVLLQPLNDTETAWIMSTSPLASLFGKTDEATKILKYLRGNSTTALEELKDYASIKKEKVNIKEILSDRIILKSITIAIFLAVASQMTGYNAVTFYLQFIFESTGTSVKPEISSAIIGCIQVFGSVCTILLTDRFGRKPILTSTFLALAIGLVGLGTFFKILGDGGEISGFLNYLPLLSMMLVIFGFNTGIGSIVWTLMSELFNGASRAFGVTTGTLTYFFFTFLTIRYFSSVADYFGPAPVYWIFAACCVTSSIFIFCFVPETKGKAFSQIQKELGRQ